MYVVQMSDLLSIIVTFFVIFFGSEGECRDIILKSAITVSLLLLAYSQLMITSFHPVLC